MKQTKTQKMKGFTLVELLVVISIIAVLASIAVPLIMSGTKAGDRAKAIANARSIAGGLLSFKNENGKYPDAQTHESLAADNENLRQGDDANAYLSQLIIEGSIDTETAFHTKGARGSVEGDDLIGSTDKLLAQGENGFAYIMAENEESLFDVKSFTPIVIAPLRKGGESPTFDDAPYAGKYVYGKVDGSAAAGEVGKNGEATSKGRESLFETGPDSFFGSDIPVIKSPLGVN